MDAVDPVASLHVDPSTHGTAQTLADLAEAIAREAHAGQEEPYGLRRPYIEHVALVADLVRGDDEKAVAWLHDVLEDTDLDVQELADRGMPPRIISAVGRLTRVKSMPYREYIDQLVASGDGVARTVKIADLMEHLQPSCPARLRPRYEAALAALQKAEAR